MVMVYVYVCEHHSYTDSGVPSALFETYISIFFVVTLACGQLTLELQKHRW